MIRPLEPRVGQNLPITTMKIEAEAFLHEMWEEGLFTVKQFNERLESVLKEIENGAVETAVWENQMQEDGEMKEVKIEGTSSSGWVQTKEELEWGVQVAWKNSRKCIMRAHFGELKLVDLRHVDTSRGMLDAVIEHLPAAYNDGKIIPTGEYARNAPAVLIVFDSVHVSSETSESSGTDVLVTAIVEFRWSKSNVGRSDRVAKYH